MTMSCKKTTSGLARLVALVLLWVFAAPGLQAIACSFPDSADQSPQAKPAHPDCHHAAAQIDLDHSPDTSSNEKSRHGLSHHSLHLVAHELFCAPDCSCDVAEQSFLVSRSDQDRLVEVSLTGPEKFFLSTFHAANSIVEATGRHRSITGPPVFKPASSRFNAFYARTGRFRA